MAATVALCIVALQYRGYITQVERYGYLGCFILNLIAGSVVVLPALSVVVSFTMGGILNPTIIGVVAGLGEATGTTTAYLIGRGGGGLFRGSNNTFYTRFANTLDRHGSKFVFFMASIINPVYYPLAIFLGMLRFGLIRFFLLTWAGRTIKNMALAYAGYFGLKFVLRWLGVTIS